MNLAIWLGFGSAIALVTWGVQNAGASNAMINAHGLTVVLGGTMAAVLINCPFRQILSAGKNFFSLFLISRVPRVDEVVPVIVGLARKSQVEGGLLSLQEEAKDFADGFLHHAITVAIATGETSETRRIVEAEIKQKRIQRQEDANVFRTIGVLSPMFGLMGTLLGMIQVLETMSEPTKVGPAMALALSSAFFGIGVANFLCVPIAGQIRLNAMRETLVLEMILEGVLDIASGKAPYLVELHLSAYAQERAEALERPVGGSAFRTSPGTAPQ